MGYRKAFGLSRDEVRHAVPPGTTQLVDHVLVRSTTGTVTDKHDELNLVPRPSSDPADPLNWSPFRKYMALLTVSLYALSANFGLSVMAPILPLIITAFTTPVAFGDIGHLIAAPLLVAGCGNLIWVPLSHCYGRRPVIVITLFFFVLFSVWCALATSYNSLLAARVMQGLAMGPSETVCADVIGEVFFVHERGRAMAVYTLFLVMGTSIGGLTGSFIGGDLGWRWVFWITVIIVAVNFLLALFFLPETLYDRQHVSTPTQEKSAHSGDDKSLTVLEIEQISYPPYTITRSLRLGVRRPGLVKHFLGPILSLRFPGVWMVMLIYGGLVGGIVTFSTIAPTLITLPPYAWGSKASLINLGGIIGVIIGAVYTYFTSDLLVKRGAHDNESGLAEPETRLPSMLPALIIAIGGLLTFGFCGNSTSSKGWIGFQFAGGMIQFGLMQVPSVGFSYIHDAYHPISGDAFVMTACFRSIVSFAWTYFVADWVKKSGTAEPFGIFAMLVGLFTMLMVAQWKFGKRTRIATAKWLPEDSYGH